MRPGLNVQLAPEQVAKQLNVRSGALVLTVGFSTYGNVNDDFLFYYLISVRQRS